MKDWRTGSELKNLIETEKSLKTLTQMGNFSKTTRKRNFKTKNLLTTVNKTKKAVAKDEAAFVNNLEIVIGRPTTTIIKLFILTASFGSIRY